MTEGKREEDMAGRRPDCAEPCIGPDCEGCDSFTPYGKQKFVPSSIIEKYLDPEDVARCFGVSMRALSQELFATHLAAVADAVKAQTDALLEIRDRWIPAIKEILYEPDKVTCDIGQIESLLAHVIPRYKYPEKSAAIREGKPNG